MAAVRTRRPLFSESTLPASLLRARGPFLLGVYALLALSFGATIGVLFAGRSSRPLGEWLYRWRAPVIAAYALAALALFLYPLLSIFLGAPEIPGWARLPLFLLYSLAFGGVLYVAYRARPTEILERALWAAIAVFASTALVGTALAIAGIDLWFGYVLLIAALLGLLVGSVVFLLLPSRSSALLRGLAIAGIVVFSLINTVDSNQLLLNPALSVLDGAIQFYVNLVSLFMDFVTAFSVDS